jgi:hypothetical protein
MDEGRAVLRVIDDAEAPTPDEADRQLERVSAARRAANRGALGSA